MSWIIPTITIASLAVLAARRWYAVGYERGFKHGAIAASLLHKNGPMSADDRTLYPLCAVNADRAQQIIDSFHAESEWESAIQQGENHA